MPKFVLQGMYETFARQRAGRVVLENVRKRQDYRLVTIPIKLMKLASQKGFIVANSFNADLIGVKIMPKKICNCYSDISFQISTLPIYAVPHVP